MHRARARESHGQAVVLVAKRPLELLTTAAVRPSRARAAWR
jgi:hypothetical protein